ncbi:MAG: hypothetical protein CMI58_03990 [Parcubacteria group bacterium]|jgi:radical SAM superfamily enzyme YgiQ (UPF0313 family)|nr:hypothetical protein [Parcubacteria group bacterium]|tara:strand:- start:534 stop:2141 length:1608 start_codon:yes stop_codon:yes gene_type:complete
MITEANFLPGSGLIEEPIGLAYIASLLEKNDYSVNILDNNIDKLDDEQILNYIKSKRPKTICIGFTTLQADDAYKLCNIIKKDFQDIHLVLCGVHPTLMPEEAFSKGNADFVVIGEEETTTLELTNALKEGKNFRDIPGLAFKENGKIIINQPRKLIKDLDNLPFPAYHLLKWKKYQTNIHGKYENKRAFNVIASRGCSFKCNFCLGSMLYGGSLRLRTVDNVIKEIGWIISNYGIEYIHFEDNDFLLRTEEWIKEFCNKIISKKIKFKWLIQTRVDSVIRFKEHLNEMRKAGCVGVELGIESGDEIVLKKINKGININKMKIANDLLKKSDIDPFYLMISYNEGENLDSAYKSAKLIYELENNCNAKSEFIPYIKNLKRNGEIPIMGHQSLPTIGTQFREDIDKKGAFFAKKWSDYTIDKINFIPIELLSDIPVKNGVDNDSVNTHIKKYENQIKEYMSTSFYLPENLVNDNFKTYEDYAGFLSELYSLCNGTTTVKKLAESISKTHNLSIQITVSGLMILSILRLIKSKNQRA